MTYPYILTPDQAELLADALMFYRQHQDKQARGYNTDAGYQTDAEYVIDEIDTLLPLLDTPLEVQITPRPQSSPAPAPEQHRSRHVFDVPSFFKIIETSPITDGSAAVVRHGITLLEARFQHDTDRRFRRFIEELNTVLQEETTYQMDEHTLSEHEVFEALTVLLRTAQHHVPEVITDPLD